MPHSVSEVQNNQQEQNIPKKLSRLKLASIMAGQKFKDRLKATNQPNRKVGQTIANYAIAPFSALHGAFDALVPPAGESSVESKQTGFMLTSHAVVVEPTKASEYPTIHPEPLPTPSQLQGLVMPSPLVAYPSVVHITTRPALVKMPEPTLPTQNTVATPLTMQWKHITSNQEQPITIPTTASQEQTEQQTQTIAGDTSKFKQLTNLM